MKKHINANEDGLPWLQNAVIYEINFPQFSESGNFKGLSQRLDTLMNLGVDVLLFSLVQPADKDGWQFIKDFKAINPNLGSSDEFRNLVDLCHLKKFKVIIPWEGKYSSAYSKIVDNHLDWFKKTKDANYSINATGGEIFDYSNKDVKNYMIGAMRWWIEEFDIDGFYSKTSDIPINFWKDARQNLGLLKHILIISDEEQNRANETVFGASGAVKFQTLLLDIFNQKKNVDSLPVYINEAAKGELRLNYIANSNTTAKQLSYKLFTEAQAAFMALIFTVEGIPMILNGTEAGHYNKIFSKGYNAIQWDYPNAAKYFEFYQTLISIRHKNPALWNNVDGKTISRVFKSTKGVYAFISQSGENKVLVVINLSDKTVKMDALEIPGLEQYSLRLNKNMKTDGANLYELGPWGYSVSTLNEPE